MTLKNPMDGVDLTTYAAARGRKMENYVAADVRLLCVLFQGYK